MHGGPHPVQTPPVIFTLITSTYCIAGKFDGDLNLTVWQRRPRRTIGRASIHWVEDAVARRLTLSWRWNRCTRPLAGGWYAVVRICAEPRKYMSWRHWSDSNCAPRSVVMVDGTPKRAIQPVMKACATVGAVMSGKGMASGQRVKRPTQVRRYVNPLQCGRGPTRSMCTWENMASRGGKWPVGVAVWWCTLERWHWKQARVHSRTSSLMPGHMYREVINHWVARTPGWERVCRMSNTWRRNCGGTSGRGTPVDVSHRSMALLVGTGTCDSVREGAAPSGGGSVNWASAIALKLMAVDVVCREPTSRRQRASAAVVVVPLIYLMSEVNWTMNSRCLSCRGERFRDWEERAKVRGLWSVSTWNWWPSTKWQKWRMAR